MSEEIQTSESSSWFSNLGGLFRDTSDENTATTGGTKVVTSSGTNIVSVEDTTTKEATKTTISEKTVRDEQPELTSRLAAWVGTEKRPRSNSNDSSNDDEKADASPNLLTRGVIKPSEPGITSVSASSSGMKNDGSSGNGNLRTSGFVGSRHIKPEMSADELAFQDTASADLFVMLSMVAGTSVTLFALYFAVNKFIKKKSLTSCRRICSGKGRTMSYSLESVVEDIESMDSMSWTQGVQALKQGMASSFIPAPSKQFMSMELDCVADSPKKVKNAEKPWVKDLLRCSHRVIKIPANGTTWSNSDPPLGKTLSDVEKGPRTSGLSIVPSDSGDQGFDDGCKVDVEYGGDRGFSEVEKPAPGTPIILESVETKRTSTIVHGTNEAPLLSRNPSGSRNPSRSVSRNASRDRAATSSARHSPLVESAVSALKYVPNFLEVRNLLSSTIGQDKRATSGEKKTPLDDSFLGVDCPSHIGPKSPLVPNVSIATSLEKRPAGFEPILAEMNAMSPSNIVPLSDSCPSHPVGSNVASDNTVSRTTINCDAIKSTVFDHNSIVTGSDVSGAQVPLKLPVSAPVPMMIPGISIPAPIPTRAPPSSTDSGPIPSTISSISSSDLIGSCSPLPRSVGFLYASPLVVRNARNTGTNCPMLPEQLSIEEEWGILEDALEPFTVNVIGSPATLPVLQEAWAHGNCRALHIAGHGITRERPNGSATSSSEISSNSDESDASSEKIPRKGQGLSTHLLLEDGAGSGVLVDDKIITSLLTNSRTKKSNSKNRASINRAVPELVFLNVCGSAGVLATAFLKAGAKHVVCASGDIADRSSRIFVRSFYRGLGSGRSVHESFEWARSLYEVELLQLYGGNTNTKFSNFMIRSADVASPERSLSQPYLLFPGLDRELNYCRGEDFFLKFSDLSLTLPSPPEDFVGRVADVWSVVQHLQRRRLVVVHCAEPQITEHGIGLSAVCEVATRYLQLRAFESYDSGACARTSTSSGASTGSAVFSRGTALHQGFSKVLRVYLQGMSSCSTEPGHWIDIVRKQIKDRSQYQYASSSGYETCDYRRTSSNLTNGALSTSAMLSTTVPSSASSTMNSISISEAPYANSGETTRARKLNQTMVTRQQVSPSDENVDSGSMSESSRRTSQSEDALLSEVEEESPREPPQMQEMAPRSDDLSASRNEPVSPRNWQNRHDDAGSEHSDIETQRNCSAFREVKRGGLPEEESQKTTRGVTHPFHPNIDGSLGDVTTKPELEGAVPKTDSVDEFPTNSRFATDAFHIEPGFPSQTPGRTDSVSSHVRAYHRRHAVNRKKNPLAGLAKELHRIGGQRILLYLDEADHLVQQPSFQDAMQRILRDCPHVSLLVSTHQGISTVGNNGTLLGNCALLSASNNATNSASNNMTGYHPYRKNTLGVGVLGAFNGCAIGSHHNMNSHVMMGGDIGHACKSVHVPIKRLSDTDSGRLFLRRVGRVVTWDELGYRGPNCKRPISLSEGDAVYRKVALSPLVHGLNGHPRAIIQAATCI